MQLSVPYQSPIQASTIYLVKSITMLPTVYKTAAAALLGLIHTSLASYVLQDDYTGSQFFDKFSFFTDNDPTHGYVDYVSQGAAQSAGLINTNNGQVYMGVDSNNIASGRGRKSVRVTSKASYNHGLFILDLQHMPGNSCGSWPAYWTVGPNWPNSGEIDIIEGVNNQNHNAVTLHTNSGCTIATSPNTGSSNGQQLFSGSISTSNCDINAPGQYQNAGCSIAAPAGNTYGDGFNANQGGVYAMEWKSSAISVWFFPRGQIPADVNNSPNPAGWGVPLASFQSNSCNINAKFSNQQIVFDTTFCGDWAGSVWSSDPTCSSKAATCQDFVRNNPQAFANAYWSINSLKVYTGGSSVESVRNTTASGTVKPSISSAISSAASMTSPCVSPWCVPTASKPSTSAVSTTTPSGYNGGHGSSSRTWRAGYSKTRTGPWRRTRETSVMEGMLLPVAAISQGSSSNSQDGLDLEMVRQHMAGHKRHGHGHGHH